MAGRSRYRADGSLTLGQRLGALASMALLAAACAASQPPPAAPLPGPDNLAGTKWKLPFTEGSIDGRVIEFKRGTSGYEGVVTTVGRTMNGKVGAREGLVLMELVPAGSKNQFKGFERQPGQDHMEVLCSVSADGRNMKCNSESTPWERQLQ